MKSVAHPAPAVAAEAAPEDVARAAGRNNALDRARTFLTIVVLIHHAVIPYTYFGHTDPTSWIGFDAIVLATDGSVRGRGGLSHRAGGATGVAIEDVGYGGVCKLQPRTDGDPDDRDQHAADRAAAKAR